MVQVQSWSSARSGQSTRVTTSAAFTWGSSSCSRSGLRCECPGAAASAQVQPAASRGELRGYKRSPWKSRISFTQCICCPRSLISVTLLCVAEVRSHSVLVYCSERALPFSSVQAADPLPAPAPGSGGGRPLVPRVRRRGQPPATVPVVPQQTAPPPGPPSLPSGRGSCMSYRGVKQGCGKINWGISTLTVVLSS